MKRRRIWGFKRIAGIFLMLLFVCAVLGESSAAYGYAAYPEPAGEQVLPSSEAEAADVSDGMQSLDGQPPSEKGVPEQSDHAEASKEQTAPETEAADSSEEENHLDETEASGSQPSSETEAISDTSGTSSHPDSETYPSGETSGKGSHRAVAEKNFSGIVLNIDGQASADVCAGETVRVAVDTSSITGGLSFAGVRAISAGEGQLDCRYDEASGTYAFVMPDSDVAIRPAVSWTAAFARKLNRVGHTGEQHTITRYSEHMNQGLLRVGYFEIDGGTLAWCTQHSLSPPAVGTVLSTAQVWSDDSTWLSTMMRRIAWYGYSGPMAETTKSALGLTDSDLWRYTSLAFSYAYGADDNYYGYGKRFVDWLSALGDNANAPAQLQVFRLTSGNALNQDLVYWTYTPEVTLTLQKVSAIPELTQGHPCYRLDGARYGVYSDADCSSLAGTLVTGADGVSNVLTLSPQTYYIKELEAPEGYICSDTVTEVVLEQEPVTVTVRDEPLVDALGLTITKIDAQTESSEGQGNASLAGAQFTVRYYDGYYTKETLPKQPERTWVLETRAVDGSDGSRSFQCGLSDQFKVSGDDFYTYEGKTVLPLGTITIEETKAPQGYMLKDSYFMNTGSGEKLTGLYIACIRGQGSAAALEGGNHCIAADYPGRGGVTFQKVDAETGTAKAQGMATLEGAVYAVINKNEQPVYVNGTLAAPGETVAQLTTDAQGRASSRADLLPCGDYALVEIKAPEGYLAEGVTQQSFSITGDGMMADLTGAGQVLSDQVIRGGVTVQKRDLESGNSSALGGASLAGAVFEIVNDNPSPVMVDGQLFAAGEVVCRITTDAQGTASTNSDALPYGKYIVSETIPPEGYLGSGVTKQAFSIAENGQMAELTSSENAIKNQVIRGDFEITKITSDTQNTMAGVCFKITSEATGESHTFTTDANGFYSSAASWNPHSKNTNAGGSGDGLWFGMDQDGKSVPVNDDLGALPFGTYMLEELRCEANRGMELYQGTLVISRHGYTVDMGNIENAPIPEPSIKTAARSRSTGMALELAKEGQTIIDTVTYDGLTPGKTYTLQGTLMICESGQALTGADGQPVRASRTFECRSENGSIELEFDVDASQLGGAQVVVFEALYLDDEVIARHEDLSDEGQTIYFPEIHTEASGETPGRQELLAEKQVRILDKVTYSGLLPGVLYHLTGTLMDAETGAAVTDSEGNVISGELSWTPETPDGFQTMEFLLDASQLGGKSLVVFERLSVDGIVAAEHTDITDASQTVHFPSISTCAKDMDSGTHEGRAQDKDTVTIIDEVTYKNLTPGKEYRLEGTLMDHSSGTPLSWEDINVTAQLIFTPQTSDGSVQAEFRLPGEAVMGKTVVVFETLYDGETKVAEHKALDDENQTVSYPEEPEESESVPETPEESERVPEESESPATEADTEPPETTADTEQAETTPDTEPNTESVPETADIAQTPKTGLKNPAAITIMSVCFILSGAGVFLIFEKKIHKK